MIVFNSKVRNFDWKVTLIKLEDYDKDNSYIRTLPSKVYNYIIDNLENVSINNAFIYTDKEEHCSYIVIGNTCYTEEIINSITHEGMHLLNHISSTFNIDSNDETLCTSLGYLLSDFIGIFI